MRVILHRNSSSPAVGVVDECLRAADLGKRRWFGRYSAVYLCIHTIIHNCGQVWTTQVVSGPVTRHDDPSRAESVLWKAPVPYAVLGVAVVRVAAFMRSRSPHSCLRTCACAAAPIARKAAGSVGAELPPGARCIRMPTLRFGPSGTARYRDRFVIGNANKA